MRLLLDECVDERLRHLFVGHECQTARYAGLAGLKNGSLLLAADAAGFDVIVTVDQSVAAQQNLSLRRIALVVLCGATNRLHHLAGLVPAAMAAIDSIKPGQVVTIR